MATGKLKVLSLCTFLAMSADPALAGQHLQYYGYYANNGYVGENYDHTNITFIGVWTSDVNQATSIILSELASAKSKGIKAIVTVSPFLFSNGGGNCPFGNQPSSAQYWSAFVSKLVADGYLVPGNPSASTVAAFYPVDEPDGCGLGDVNGAANPALVNAISTIRNNSNTANFPVAAIFSSNYASAARGIQLYDWVGYDNYSLKDWNYVSSFDQFENYVNLSRQRTILVPQAATGGPLNNQPDDPSIMLSAAESDSSVIMLMPFLWAHDGMYGTKDIPWLRVANTYVGKQIKYGLFAKFAGQSVPSVMNAGQTYQVTVQFQNTGTATWNPSQSFNLGTQNPRDGTEWTTYRVPVPSNIAPGQTANFTFNVKAPTQIGIYNFQWKMVEDGTSWFGELTPNVAINVVTPPSGYISASPVPCSIYEGEATCTSAISWSTNRSDAQVWVVPSAGGTPQLFAAGQSGTQKATWITTQHDTFYLVSSGSKFGTVDVYGKAVSTPPPHSPGCPMSLAKYGVSPMQIVPPCRE